MLIDSHCHLEYEGLADRQDEVLANARAVGVQGFLNISTRRSEWDRVVGTATRASDVWASVGIRPRGAAGAVPHAHRRRTRDRAAGYHPHP